MSRSTSPGGFLYGLNRKPLPRKQEINRSNRGLGSRGGTIKRTDASRVRRTYGEISRAKSASRRIEQGSRGVYPRPRIRASSAKNPSLGHPHTLPPPTVTDAQRSMAMNLEKQKRQRFMALQRQRLGRYVRWVNLVLYDELDEEMQYFERRLHGYAYSSTVYEPLTVETFFDRMKDGLVLCSLVDTLEMTSRMLYGIPKGHRGTRDTGFPAPGRGRHQQNSALFGVHKKPSTKASCCENIDKALRLIWSKGVMASVCTPV